MGPPREENLRTIGRVLDDRPEPMDAVLAALDRPPDLVVADQRVGRRGGAGRHRPARVADCNDPALFVAQQEGRPLVTVPLDDNVLPHRFDPLVTCVTVGWS